MILENKGHDPSAKSNTVDYELKKGHLYRKLPEKFVYDIAGPSGTEQTLQRIRRFIMK